MAQSQIVVLMVYIYICQNHRMLCVIVQEVFIQSNLPEFRLWYWCFHHLHKGLLDFRVTLYFKVQFPVNKPLTTTFASINS